MTLGDIILDNIPSIIATLLAAIPAIWLVVQKVIDRRQSREEKKLEYDYSSKITTIGNNFELIDQKVLQCYENNLNQLQMEEEVRKLVDLHKMNAISQTAYIRHANLIWTGFSVADRVNRNQ